MYKTVLISISQLCLWKYIKIETNSNYIIDYNNRLYIKCEHLKWNQR